MEHAAVRTVGLGKRYGSVRALSDCTLEVPAGSITALVGPNGAGKTTLLHLVIGLMRPTSGSVEVLGHSPYAKAAELLPRLGFVAQDHPLYRNLTVAETLELGRRLNPGWDAPYARERVGRLGLDGRRKVGTLSDGDRKSVV